MRGSPDFAGDTRTDGRTDGLTNPGLTSTEVENCNVPQGTSSTLVLQLTDWPTEWLTDWRFEDFEETQLVQQRLLHQVRPSYKRVSIWETTTAPAQSHAVVKTRCIKKNTMAPAFSYPIRSWTENPVWFSEEHSAWEQYNAFNRPNSKNSQKPPFWHFGSFKNAFWMIQHARHHSPNVGKH